MSAKKKKKKNGFETFLFVVIILPVLIANLIAGWKIMQIAKRLEVPLIGPLHDGPTMLLAVLSANIVLIVALVLTRK